MMVPSNITLNFSDVLTLRVVGATERDLKRIVDLLGPPRQGDSLEDVDLTLRFEDQLDPGRMNLLGINQFGFTENQFFVLNEFSGKPEVSLPMDEIGGPCEIVYQQGSRLILLEEIIKVRLLQKGILSLHASTIEFNGTGITLIGWARGGKTSAALAYFQKGAKFVADDWVILNANANRVLGFPSNLSISDYNIRNLPKINRRITFSQKAKLNSRKMVFWLMKQVSGVVNFRMLKKLTARFSEKLRVDMKQTALFSEDEVAPFTSPDVFVLLTSRNDENFKFQTAQLEKFVTSLRYGSETELTKLTQAYQAFCFAFPEKRNLFLEDRGTFEEKLMKEIFADKKIYQLYHPYPLPIGMIDSIFTRLQRLYTPES